MDSSLSHAVPLEALLLAPRDASTDLPRVGTEEVRTAAPQSARTRSDGGPRVAIVHDYLTQRGGAERVVLAMLQAFPDATLYTSVYDPAGTFPEFADYDIRTSGLQRVGMFRRDPRTAMPLLPWAMGQLKIDDVDAVLCSSSGWAHGVQTDAPKIVYCHNPPRWVYQAEDYVGGMGRTARTVAAALRPMLRRWDKRAAASVHTYFVNSTAVQGRVKSSYGIDAERLAPPMSMDVDGFQEPMGGVTPGYYLAIGRSRGYKNMGATVEAFSRMQGKRLIMVGGDHDDLSLPHNVRSAGRVSDGELRWLYANCKALVATAHEDFGLTPIEANAFGKPVFVLRAGGYLDSLSPGVSGLFIDSLTSDAIVEAVLRGDLTRFDEAKIRAHADTYSLRAFSRRLADSVDQMLAPTAADRRAA